MCSVSASGLGAFAKFSCFFWPSSRVVLLSFRAVLLSFRAVLRFAQLPSSVRFCSASVRFCSASVRFCSASVRCRLGIRANSRRFNWLPCVLCVHYRASEVAIRGEKPPPKRILPSRAKNNPHFFVALTGEKQPPKSFRPHRRKTTPKKVFALTPYRRNLTSRRTQKYKTQAGQIGMKQGNSRHARLARFRARARRCARSAPETQPNRGNWTSKNEPSARGLL